MTGAGTIRAAIVGLRHSHVGRLNPKNSSPGHAHSFKQLKGVEVVAYCEDTDSRLLDDARAFDPNANLYHSVDELIDREDFQLACVCLPANEVPVAGIKLANAGKHFFMEKQFGRTAADLARLAEAIHRNGVKVLPAYPWRFHPVAQALGRMIEEGALGKPISLESRLVTTQVRPGLRAPDGFLYRDETEGGGILHMLGGHYLEAMRYLAGCEVKAVQAMVGRPVGFIEAPLEDIGIMAMEYENGAFGSLHAGYLLPARDDGYDSCLTFRGEHGWAKWGPVGAPRLEVKSVTPQWAAAPTRTLDFALAPFSGYGRSLWMFDLVQRFVDGIKANRPPELTVDDALHILQLIEAAYESSRTGRRVEVAYGVAAALAAAAA